MADSETELALRMERHCKPCLNRGIQRSADISSTKYNDLQCFEPSNINTKFDFVKDHTFSNVSRSKIGNGFQKVTSDLKNIDLNGLFVCKKHKKALAFYCKDDKVLACRTCVFSYHRKCDDLVEVDDIAEDDRCKRTDCGNLVENLKTAKTSLNQAIENLNTAESLLSEDVNGIPNKLSKLRTNVIKMFDEFAENLIKDANLHRDQTTADLAKRKLECETELTTMEHTLDKVNNAATNGTKRQRFLTAHRMTKAILNDVQKGKSLYSDLEALNVSGSFNWQFHQLSSSLVSAMTPSEFEIEYSVPKRTKLELVASIDLTDVGQPLYSGIDFLPDGRLVALDNVNGKCLLYDENLTLKFSYKILYKHPARVVVVSEKEVAITTKGNYILVFLHISKSHKITCARAGIVNFSVKYDHITMKDEDNFMVSAINHTPPVHMLSTSAPYGERDFDIEFPSKRYQVGSMSCTYIHGQDKIVLTDSEADTVDIYDVTTDGHVAIKDERIKVPCGVAVGPYDRVFVCSKRTHSLVEISPAGHVLSSHPVDARAPCTLAISKDGQRLAVTNATPVLRKLVMYKILSE